MSTHERTELVCATCSEPSPAAAPVCAACGQDPLLDGRYRLDTVLGRGAMGVTFRATRLADGATVAAKELPLHRVDSLKTAELFEREANVLRALAHPSIPAWVDHFTTGSGKQMALWILQEFIDGDTLEDLAAARRPNEREVLGTLRELLMTLVYLAELRPPVIHRDLKPQNMMRRRADNSFVLIDFGSVRDAIRDSLEGGSTVAGTFGYMAPEQFAGRASSVTDVYGAGATALALLAGTGAERLLGSDGRLDWHGRVVMSDGLRRLLDRMIAIEPAHRLSAAEALSEVERLLVPPPSVAPAVAQAARDTDPPRQGRGSRPAPRMTVDRAPQGDPSTAVPPSQMTRTPRIVAVLGGLFALVVFGVVAFSVARTSDKVAEIVAAPAPKVAPPLGLVFGMSRRDAETTWPALADATAMPVEHVKIESGYGRDGMMFDFDALLASTRAETPPVAGTAFEAPATFGQLGATCQVRFAALNGASEAGLVAFKCELDLDGPDQRDVVTKALVSGWTERFGPPTGGRAAQSAANQRDPFAHMGLSTIGVAALWQGTDATVQIVTSYNGVSLEGETHAWQTHQEAAVSAASEAWRRTQADKARALTREAEERAKGLGADL